MWVSILHAKSGDEVNEWVGYAFLFENACEYVGLFRHDVCYAEWRKKESWKKVRLLVIVRAENVWVGVRRTGDHLGLCNK